MVENKSVGNRKIDRLARLKEISEAATTAQTEIIWENQATGTTYLAHPEGIVYQYCPVNGLTKQAFPPIPNGIEGRSTKYGLREKTPEQVQREALTKAFFSFERNPLKQTAKEYFVMNPHKVYDLDLQRSFGTKRTNGVSKS